MSSAGLASGTAPWGARTVLALLARMPHGRLHLQLPDGRRMTCGAGPLEAAAQVRDWRAFSHTLRAGDIGLAEGFIDGWWDTPDLAGLMRLLVAHRELLERGVYGSWWGALLYRLRHALNRNTRRGSAKNVQAHYDLGNAFYALWLDEGMNYSAACFDDDPARPLAQAQQAKLQRVLRQAGVGPGTRLLEIGCGWGGLALVAARDQGAHVTGITLSPQQLAWAQAQVQAAGVAERCELRLQDYRDLAAQHERAPFDAIVSIEMFEAVGRDYWPAFFDTLRRCLKPGGRACIQTITIRDDLFERYARSTDFIQQYVFPGGLLPSRGQFEAAAGAAGLRVVARRDFGADYARTLRHWRERFLAQPAEVRRLGFDERFLRLWHFYLAYCEAAFDAGNTDVSHYTLARPPL